MYDFKDVLQLFARRRAEKVKYNFTGIRRELALRKHRVQRDKLCPGCRQRAISDAERQRQATLHPGGSFGLAARQNPLERDFKVYALGDIPDYLKGY